MHPLFPPILILHIGAGFLAVAAGLAPILTRKGSRLHRLCGRVFAAVMAVVLAGAWVMTALRFNAYFAALSATATLTLFSGLRVLRRKRPDLRASDRAQAVDWLAALAALGAGAWVLMLVLTGQTGARTVLAAAMAYGALLYGGWDLWRFARPMDWPFSPSLWLYEHLVKMLSAYGAALSAFSGNYLTFLPAPWSQLWPTLIFQPLMIVWVIVLARRRRPALAARTA